MLYCARAYIYIYIYMQKEEQIKANYELKRLFSSENQFKNI
jgi:hypothetical protein